MAVTDCNTLPALRACRPYHRAAGDRSHHSSRRLFVRPGIMGIGQGKVQPSSRNRRAQSADKASATPRATTRGLTLAKSGKSEEALAEFDRALALDPYNVQALYGRGLIYQADKRHEQAIADFTAANGLTPQRVELLLARATSYLAIDKARRPLPISTRRCRPIPTARKPGRLAASPMNV